jgi:hypothetical protein
MARLTIGGQVLYANATPAAGARVTIDDLDSPGEHDRILDAVADADGRFSGRSLEWKDREGRVLGIDIPDILRLEFTARADGRTHRGPFLRNGSSSAPIILPFGPPRPVTKAERELVQIILVSDGYTGAERAMYEFIEVATEGLTTAILGPHYQRMTFVKGAAATLDGVTSALNAAAGRSGVEAVDLLFTTHGSGSKMTLADGEVKDTTLGSAITARLSPARLAKLRIVFSTACFGETHLDMWTDVGFTEASGAEGIYADSAVSYAPFLTAWAAERTFAEAVAAANAADVGNAADQAARAFYLARNLPVPAAQVDSDRVRAGTGTTRVYSTA